MLWLYHGISPVVYAEYGEELPSVTAFCQAEDAYFKADERCAALGRHVVPVVIGLRQVPCLLIVRDTLAPTADKVAMVFPSGYEPTPTEFITNVQDADVVGVSFDGKYDFSEAGQQAVTILLEDGSGNRIKVQTTATVQATREAVTVEAGSQAPSAAAFCEEGFQGTLLTEITETMLHTPGDYPLQLQCTENGRIFSSVLQVRDTVPPVAEGKILALQPGEAAVPEAFISQFADETALTFSFAVAPDPDRRDVQDILIQVTDAGGNSTDVAAQAVYSSLGTPTVEVKNALLTPEDIGIPGCTVEDFMADRPGTYAVRVIDASHQEQFALVTLTDTTAPVLSIKEGTFYTKHPLSPEELVQVSDVTQVSLSYVTEPDWNSAAEQTFQVKAMDAAGNESIADFSLTLTDDINAPLLYGVVDRITYVDEPILYLKEAYAEDDVDGRVDLSVDSQVISSLPGTYAVVYTATDKSGNSASQSCTYTLVKSTTSEEQLNELVDAVLKKIIKPDMVTAEKLKAVFTYVQKQVRYTGSSDKTDWRKEAVRGLTKRKGDCFTFYSVTRALLDKLDIPYMSVERLGHKTRHYWLIVNIGTGWYHLDTLVNHILPYKCFMWTNRQLQLMPLYFWRYDEAKYPPIATDPFDYNAVVKMEKEGLLP